MNKNIIFILTVIIFFLGKTVVFAQKEKPENNLFITYIVNTKKQNIKFYWKDDKKLNFKNIQNLKLWLESKHQKLLFAMNGGMYKSDNSPQGLFIENQKTITQLDTSNGKGNFYLKPNGVFYIKENNNPVICNTTNFNNNGKIKYATQSGPMLIINGQLHPKFKKDSKNFNIRNGVGILPDNKVVFVMSKKEVNFYDFAMYFKTLGCKNALYLDGFVSRTYFPEKGWEQTDGNFGVIIGIIENTN